MPDVPSKKKNTDVDLFPKHKNPEGNSEGKHREWCLASRIGSHTNDQDGVDG